MRGYILTRLQDKEEQVAKFKSELEKSVESLAAKAAVWISIISLRILSCIVYDYRRKSLNLKGNTLLLLNLLRPTMKPKSQPWKKILLLAVTRSIPL